MNVKERDEWVKAVRACFPEHDTRPLAAAARSLEGPGRWEVSVRGGGLHIIGLRFFGSGPYAPWREACARAFSLGGAALPSAPREGFPWLTAAWDLRTGDWTSARLTGADGSKLKPGSARAWDFKRGEKAPRIVALDPKPFKPGVFKEPALDAALADFAALCPISSMAIHDGGWSLRLADGPRWPLFARCDLSAAFTPDSSQLALFMLDRRVAELSFDGDALWAHCRG